MHLTTFNVRCIMSDARNELSERCKSANIDITGCLGGLLIILGAFLPWFTSTTFGIMTLPQFQLIHTMFCLIFLSLGIALTLLSFTNKFKPKLILTFVHLVCLSAFSVVHVSISSGNRWGSSAVPILWILCHCYWYYPNFGQSETETV